MGPLYYQALHSITGEADVVVVRFIRNNVGKIDLNLR
jgi:hypothetical protein